MARRKNRLPRQLPEDGCLQWLVRVGADTVARLCSGIMVPVRYIMEMLRQRLLHGEPEPRPIGPIPITDEAADEQRAPGSGVLQSRGRGRNPNNYYAIKPERLDPHRHRSPPAPGPTNPMTDEAEGSHTATAGTDGVPIDVQSQYSTYVTLSSQLNSKSIICHMCFFEQQLHQNSKVPIREIILHCHNMHKIRGIKCNYNECEVRVRKEDDLKLHRHFCHGLELQGTNDEQE
ncbi:hypothetical protein ZEAMMB73_Zm00001d002212 [Zea mays]|uniref:Uncharacterized protein n=1 Tax=Zea mays TaxID=4577 RepID=A0A1D6DXN8_MAIZE|nr:hypothetical protein ZEAMMB73_Zm00001d002212 [Zea mays]